MKTVELNILKKNRIWIECEDKKGYKVKLKKCEKSELLENGIHTLLVDDISVRSKYGTDIRYELKDNVKNFIFLVADYNHDLVDEARSLGGRWDSESFCWAFSDIVKDKVEELEYLYCSKKNCIEITAIETISIHTDSVYFCGIPIAKASGRDSGAKLCEGVSMIKGTIDSAGSRANWCTKICAGAVFRLKVPENKLKRCFEDESALWEINNLGE